MKSHTIIISYWIATGVFALWLVGDGLGGVFQAQAGKDALAHLGYPMYLLVITGVFKLLAAVAILQSVSISIKEWAFAGYAFTCILACASRASVGDSLFLTIMPIIFLAIMFIPYILWKRKLQLGI